MCGSSIGPEAPRLGPHPLWTRDWPPISPPAGCARGCSWGRAAEGERVFAFHPHQDAFVVGEGDALALGSADPRTATLLPLVETALQVTLDAGPRLGETVAVIGLGAVGILAGALLERAGAEVIGSGPDPMRPQAAGLLGLRSVEPGGPSVRGPAAC